MEHQGVLSFIGYGADDPAVVFLGYEEHCPIGALAINLRVRNSFAARIDKFEASLRLAAACKEAGLLEEEQGYLDDLRTGSVTVWSFAAKLCHLYFGTATWQQHYRDVGTREGRTFLAERYPLPRPSRRTRHEGFDERDIERQHAQLLRSELFDTLKPGTLVVSYAGRPTNLTDPMQRTNRVAWRKVGSAFKKSKAPEVARNDRFVVLHAAFPRPEQQGWWEQWLPAAVSAVHALRREITTDVL